MALTFDATNCKDWNSLPAYKREGIIFATMITGLDKNWTLGEAYAEEFYIRISFYEQLFGAMTYNENGEYSPFTVEDVKKAIGLKTNVAPITWAAFLKNLATDSFRRERSWEWNKNA